MSTGMGTGDTIQAIEDEPYQGFYRGLAGGEPMGAPQHGHLPDRFDLAEMFRTTRERQGLSLDEVAEITRVRRVYLEALEQAAYDVLPPRAFAIGYVKAYAKALHLDEETLADMFKRDQSEANVRLHAPSGASLEDVKPNYQLFISAALCLVAAIVIWNVLQHNPALLSSKGSAAGDPFAKQSWSQGVPLIHDGAIYVTKPAPAPKDQDIPAPYVTPGLEEGFASIAAKNSTGDNAPVPVQDVLQTRKAFNPHGAVYGAQPENSAVTLQATKSVNVIVRNTAGIVYFAHQLGEGEAYRLPQNDQQDLLVEVSDPSALEVYYNGEYTSTVDVPLSQVARLNARAAGLSAALDAKQASAGQVSSLYKNPTPAPERPQIEHKSDAPIPYMPVAHPVVKPAPVHAAAKSDSSKSETESSEAPKVETPAPEAPAPTVPAQ